MKPRNRELDVGEFIKRQRENAKLKLLLPLTSITLQKLNIDPGNLIQHAVRGSFVKVDDMWGVSECCGTLDR